MYVDHIAFVTSDIKTITDSLPAFCKPLALEEHPAEGTREQYIDVADEPAPRLLLMQPISDGPYLRALNKRGAGLHHIGGVTPSIKALLPEIQQSKLLLHPISLTTYERNVVWLCRPGVPFLIELVESHSRGMENGECTLRLPTGLSIPDFVIDFFSNLSLQNSDDGRFYLTIGTREISFYVV